MGFAFLILLALIIPSAIIHEYAHGWMADRLGDPTARYAGRLTLNPMAHIDPIGTFALPIILGFASGGTFMFAYAKPVPFNPYNLKYPRWGPAMVGAAGPASNLLLALVFAFIIPFTSGDLMNVLVGVVFVNIMLAVFNLVPIPPLDGSKLLYASLPRSAENVKRFLDRYGLIIFVVFVFYGVKFISPIMFWLLQLLVDTPALIGFFNFLG
tara:strand:- start:735 stop:1367 length:633 start_codon:yes stop_codon:yes gene_type:complete